VTGILGTLRDGVLEVETPHGTQKVPLAAIERAQLQRDLGQLLKQTRH